MRYLVLATDYDGTLAQEGRVSAETVDSLEKLRRSGRKTLLVTGRQTEDLRTVFDRFDLFDRIVAENGALLLDPASGNERLLVEPPPATFLDALTQAGIPFSVGRAVVATVEPHDGVVLQTIKRLGLELQVIFNKGSVMVLPSGTNKATGLMHALRELGLSHHNVVGVGDAENDHAFLAACECGVAVQNALEMLKQRADFVTPSARGQGVRELIAEILRDDLITRDAYLKRPRIVLGHRNSEEQFEISPSRNTVLVAGPSGSGKSSATSGLLERITELGYQIILIDPEGDYEGFPGMMALGGGDSTPQVNEILQALQDEKNNLVVSLIGMPLADRPAFFTALFPELTRMRARLGRPHWIVLDEAHHMLPKDWGAAERLLPQTLENVVLISVHPDWLAQSVLDQVSVVMAVGKSPADTLQMFETRSSQTNSAHLPESLGSGEAVVWSRTTGKAEVIRYERAAFDRKRHIRKYAEGELPPERSFYFKGPESKLNLRAHNVTAFMQLGDGVDKDTWMYHLRRGDYSGWFRSCIKDEALAREAAEVENNRDLDADASRQQIRTLLRSRYTTE